MNNPGSKGLLNTLFHGLSFSNCERKKSPPGRGVIPGYKSIVQSWGNVLMRWLLFYSIFLVNHDNIRACY